MKSVRNQEEIPVSGPSLKKKIALSYLNRGTKRILV